jgi:hypothetical protein
MKKFRKLLMLLMIVGLVVAYMQSSESTKRYIKHIGKQVPSLPYRYFI